MFSRDRAAQLDLLLRSLRQNAPGISDEVTVIVKAEGEYLEAYKTCHRTHSQYTAFSIETDPGDFHRLARGWIDAAKDHVAFFVDDDVLYRPLPIANPAPWLDLFPETVCFSLRLGRNTRRCYPMGDAPQAEPDRLTLGEFDVWRWRAAELDYGYPGSLDGGIFRRSDLLVFLKDAEFSNPNQLEEALVRATAKNDMWRNHLASFKQSVLCGIPANRVNETHPNRSGDQDVQELNDLYLNAKRRLSLDTVDPNLVGAAHVEFRLRWDEA